MTPTETVLAHYKLPPYIEALHPLQIDDINSLAELPEEAKWHDMGTGKTLMAIVCGLYHHLVHGHQIVVIMPPLLVPQWARVIRAFSPAPSVCEYKGTPKQRAKLDLSATFVLVGIQIFKRDYKRFVEFFTPREYTVVIDESSSVANIESDNFEKVYDFTTGRARILLNGTPTGRIVDAYGQLKFSAPGAYENLKEFMRLHVTDVDFFDQPCEFDNLGLLKQRLMINAKRILFDDMHKGVEEPLIDPIYYDLEPAHYETYSKLAEEGILELENGGKIDATSANKLLHALGQIVVNWGRFIDQPGLVSAAIDMVEQKLKETGDQKLVVFVHYRMTAAMLKEKFEKYKAVVVNGDVSQVQKDRNVEMFKTDPACRLIIVQIISGGKGLDGLQHVCHRCMFIEPCQLSRDFWQCVARLRRTGQKHRVHVMTPVANGTLQVRGFRNLLKNSDLINEVVRNAHDLRELIYGR